MWFKQLLRDFWLFLKEEKAWWLGPIVIVLLLLSGFIALTANSTVLPFIYTLF